MRMIVILAVASITFATTLPVSAQQAINKTCQAIAAQAENEMEKVCGDDAGLLIFAAAWSDEDFKTFLARLSVAGFACATAMLKFVDTCDVPKLGDKVISKYKTPHAPVTPRDPRSPPSAGLLETSPGFSPQGPAATGTPAGIPSRSKGY
jgi:hypothetical protein